MAKRDKRQNALIEMLRNAGIEVQIIEVPQPKMLVIEQDDLVGLLVAVMINTAENGVPKNTERTAQMLVNEFIRQHKIHHVEIVDEYAGDGFQRTFHISEN